MHKNMVKITKGNRISVPNEYCKSFDVGEGDFLLFEWEDITGKKNIKPPVIMPAKVSRKFKFWDE